MPLRHLKDIKQAKQLVMLVSIRLHWYNLVILAEPQYKQADGWFSLQKLFTYLPPVISCVTSRVCFHDRKKFGDQKDSSGIPPGERSK